MPPVARLAVTLAAALAAQAPSQPTHARSSWVTVDRADAIEVAVDTVAYRPTSGDGYRFPLRLEYVRRTAPNAALWDMGARRMVLDEEVSCGRTGRPLRLRTHWVRLEDASGATVGEQRAPAEWATPPRGSLGARYGSAVCRMLPGVGGRPGQP